MRTAQDLESDDSAYEGTRTSVSFTVSTPERALCSLSRLYSDYLQVRCGEFGVSRTQVSLLGYLWHEKDGANQNEIARALGVDKGTVSRNVRSLVRQGLITQSQCDHDNRACVITLTDAGRSLRDPVDRISRAWADALLDDMNVDQRDRFLQALREMTSRAEALAKDLGSVTGEV